MRTAFSLQLAFSTALLVGLASPAAAFPILVSFTGAISQVDANLASAFSDGAPVSGSFEYESTTPDVQPGNPVFANYSEAPSNGSFQFGTYTATGTTGSIQIDLAPVHVFGVVLGSAVGAPVGAFSLTGLQLRLDDSTGTVFPDDSLPTTLDLGDFDMAAASLVFSDGTTPAFVTADLTTLTFTPVPEPAAAALLLAASLAGVLALAHPGRRPRAR